MYAYITHEVECNTFDQYNGKLLSYWRSRGNLRGSSQEQLPLVAGALKWRSSKSLRKLCSFDKVSKIGVI